MMSKHPLVSLESLLRVKNALRTRIARALPGVALDAGDVGDARAWSLLFEHWPDLVSGVPMDREDAFYNRYYWLRRYATLKQERDGDDAGLEQQVFQLLEQPDFELDWELVERLSDEATQTRRSP